MTYRKRRIQHAVNKNDAKVRRRESMGSNGVRLEDKFSSLERLSIQLSFYNAKGDFLTESQLSFGRKDLLNLQVDCMGPCGNGKIDMEEKVTQEVQAGKTNWEGRGKCAQLIHFDSGEVCGYELRCRFETK